MCTIVLLCENPVKERPHKKSNKSSMKQCFFKKYYFLAKVKEKKRPVVYRAFFNMSRMRGLILIILRRFVLFE